MDAEIAAECQDEEVKAREENFISESIKDQRRISSAADKKLPDEPDIPEAPPPVLTTDDLPPPPDEAPPSDEDSELEEEIVRPMKNSLISTEEDYGARMCLAKEPSCNTILEGGLVTPRNPDSNFAFPESESRSSDKSARCIQKHERLPSKQVKEDMEAIEKQLSDMKVNPDQKLMEAFLLKAKDNGKQYRKKYIELYGDRLLTFTAEKKPQRTMQLTGESFISEDKVEDVKQEFAFTLRPKGFYGGDKYFFAATSEEERQKWMKVVGGQIAKQIAAALREEGVASSQVNEQTFGTTKKDFYKDMSQDDVQKFCANSKNCLAQGRLFTETKKLWKKKGSTRRITLGHIAKELEEVFVVLTRTSLMCYRNSLMEEPILLNVSIDSLVYPPETDNADQTFVFLPIGDAGQAHIFCAKDGDEASLWMGKLVSQICQRITKPAQMEEDKNIGTPFNVQHHTHVDRSFKWVGQSLQESFRLESVMGQGAFGKVWKAKHKQAGFYLAVKMINLDKVEKKDLVTEKKAEDLEGRGGKTTHLTISDIKAIKDEVEILRKCRNRNIVTYYGCGTDPGKDGRPKRLWLLMDLCEVGSVCELTSEFQLAEDQVAYILACTLRALAYLHASEVIHRDVKGNNILLTHSGEVKLADFGVSHQLANNVALDLEETKPGEKKKLKKIAGSPLWMAPEVIRGEPPNEKHDIWALGITAIEIAEGRPPLTEIGEQEGLRALLLHIIKNPPPNLHFNFWSDDFVDFVSKCLTYKGAKRPTALDLLRHPFIMNAPQHECLSPVIQKHVLFQRAVEKGVVI